MLTKNNHNFSLMLQYFFFSNNSFFRVKSTSTKSFFYLINYSLFYYTVISIKYSTSFYKPSLLEMFSYELPNLKLISVVNFKNPKFSVNSKPQQTLVLVFFISSFSSYLFLMFNSTNKQNHFLYSSNTAKFESIENLFFNAN